MYNYKPPKVICEIGCNHMGNFDLAKEMIKIACEFCNVDVVKFQKRSNNELLGKDYYKPHPNPENSYGKNYGEHRDALEFNIDQHKELKKYCESFDKIYSSSVWDITSAKEIISLNPELIKIPSAMNLNFNLLKYVLENYNGEIHISLGMTFKNEIEKLIKFFEINNKLSNLVLYYCKSTYPVYEKNLDLLEIVNLQKKYGHMIKCIGFSGHHTGISVDVSALTLGAEFFERHFTLDRTYKGTDHSASLEPDGMRRLVRNLKETFQSLTEWDGKIEDEELFQRNKLKVIKYKDNE